MAGPDEILETDVYNGENGHAAKHNAVNEQVNWLTENIGGGGGYEPPEDGIPLTDLADDVQTTLLRADSSRFTGPLALGGLIPVMTRAHMATGGPASTSETQVQTRTRHQSITRANIVRLVYTNFNIALNGLGSFLPITVRAGLEDPYGGVTPLTFGGKRDAVIDPGGMVISDPIAIDAQPASGSFPYYWSRTLVTSAGGGWPLQQIGGGGNVALSGDSYEHGNSLTDRTLSNGTFGTAGVSQFWGYSPTAIVGDAPGRNSCVFGLGDSITAGVGDGGVANGAQGFLARALVGAGIPNILRGLSSEQAKDSFVFVGTQAHTLNGGGPSRANAFASGCSHIYAQHGVNDLQIGLGAQTLAGLKAVMIAYWIQAAYRAARVIGTTLTPITSSTDAWATTSNQTPTVNGQNAVRTAYNDWVRDGAPIDPATKVAAEIGTSGALRIGQVGHPLYAYDDIADAAESARNSGIWKAGFTSDGVHPNTTGSAALAAAVNLAHLAL